MLEHKFDKHINPRDSMFIVKLTTLALYACNVDNRTYFNKKQKYRIQTFLFFILEFGYFGFLYPYL